MTLPAPRPPGVQTRLFHTDVGAMLAEATPHGVARLAQVSPHEVDATWFNVKHHRSEDDDEVGPDRTGRPGQVHGPDAVDAAGRLDRSFGHLDRVERQVQDYLAGRLREFRVDIDWEAAGVHDEFSREVYCEIQHIPYGHTSTYGQISIDAGRPRNARRVGRLCSLVPVTLVIPVHRVIRADGGMGRCPEYRLRLLQHEREVLAAGSPRTV